MTGLSPRRILASVPRACGRWTILAVLVAAAAAPAAAQGRTYVFVHGAWGCGCSFRGAGEGLSALGHRVYRPSLTGLGDRVHLASPGIDLDTHVEDIVNLLRFEELDDVILVGHSYGGMVITGVADRVPERIRRLVYLDALLPEDGETAFELLGAAAARFEEHARGGFLIPAWVPAGSEPPHDVPHPRRTFAEPIRLPHGGAHGLPGTFILTRAEGSSRDLFEPFAERARERGWEVVTMGADHNPHLSALPALLALLAAIE